MSDKRIGFLRLLKSEGLYIGVLLVTDLSSVPVEFKVTLPVKPSPIQRSLYGSVLVPHIGAELCGKLLLEKVKLKPDLIMVTADYMLNLRSSSDVPIIQVQKSDETAETPSLSDDEVAPQRSCLDLPGGAFQPITICSAPDFAEDLDVARPLVEELWSKFDLLEPFDRIEQTLPLLQERNPRLAK